LALIQQINDYNNNHNQKNSNFSQFDDELKKLAAEVIAATNELSNQNKMLTKSTESIHGFETTGI
jgi:hypothetical protein